MLILLWKETLSSEMLYMNLLSRYRVKSFLVLSLETALISNLINATSQENIWKLAIEMNNRQNKAAQEWSSTKTSE